ncbi:MalY/PatB family protein [Acidaminobacterium chupaoyuni]
MYEFEKMPERRGTSCVKWDMADEAYHGKDLLPMWIADMDLEVAPAIVDALAKRVQHKVFGYDFLGDDYYEAVISWMKRRHHYEIDKDSIVFTAGIVCALHMAVLAATQPGDEVLISTPVYGPFFGAIKDEGRTIVDAPLKEENGYYSMDFEAMEKAVTPKTKAFLLCSPHNPVGRVWKREELEQIDAFCRKHGITVISDEIHNDLVLSGEHIVYGRVSEYAKQHCIICTAPSKTFNLAGIQASNILIANPELREKFKAQVNKNHMSANVFAGPAVKAAYNESEAWLEELLELLRGNCRYFVNEVAEKLPELKVAMPEGTYLLWLDCRGLGMSEEELGNWFAQECGIAANVGSWFGENGTCFRRLNMACPRALVEDCFHRIEKAVKKLRK